jgi:hypothetical protein
MRLLPMGSFRDKVYKMKPHMEEELKDNIGETFYKFELAIIWVLMLCNSVEFQ